MALLLVLRCLKAPTARPNAKRATVRVGRPVHKETGEPEGSPHGRPDKIERTMVCKYSNTARNKKAVKEFTLCSSGDQT